MNVSLERARDRSLPAVSVRSGEAASGYVRVVAASRHLYLPMTEAEFERVHDLRHRQRWATIGGVGCLVVGVALSRVPLLMGLAVVIAVVSAVLWLLLALTLRTSLPSAAVDGATVELRRVHPAFAAAVKRDCW